MSRSVIVVRCPKCGSTNAGEVEAVGIEFTRMGCAVCAHDEICDNEQIKDGWNLRVDLPDDATALPPFVTPELFWRCAACRSAPPVSPEHAAALVAVKALHATHSCPACFTCYRPGGAGAGDELAQCSPATSTALHALARGALTLPAMRALAAVEGFSLAALEDALSPDVDLAPVLDWCREELSRDRPIRWSLVAVAARGTSVALGDFVPALAAALARAHDDVDARALLDALEALAARDDVDLAAALPVARASLEADATLWHALPHLARRLG